MLAVRPVTPFLTTNHLSANGVEYVFNEPCVNPVTCLCQILNAPLGIKLSYSVPEVRPPELLVNKGVVLEYSCDLEKIIFAVLASVFI